MTLNVFRLGPLIVQDLITGFLHSVKYSKIVVFYRRYFRITKDISGAGMLLNKRETLK